MKKVKKMKKKMKKKGGGASYIFFIGYVILAGVFLPTSLLLMVGMLPSIVAFFVHGKKEKQKAISVAAANITGCLPFMFHLWFVDHSISTSIRIASQPSTILVTYAAAALGYIAYWALVGMVSGVLYERGKSRLKSIEAKKKELVQRWGKKVTGEIPLDERGFPLDH